MLMKKLATRSLGREQIILALLRGERPDIPNDDVQTSISWAIACLRRASGDYETPLPDRLVAGAARFRAIGQAPEEQKPTLVVTEGLGCFKATHINGRPADMVWHHELEGIESGSAFDQSLARQLRQHCRPPLKPTKIPDLVSAKTFAVMVEQAKKDAAKALA